MVTETSAVTLRQNLGEMLNRVQYRRENIVIKRDGKTVAALIDPALFERIQLMRDRFDELTTKLAEAYSSVPEEAGMAEVDELVRRERRRR